jgi:hypothetical protein
MRRWTVVLSAAAIGMLASSQAQASYQVIRWTSGVCQIWVHNIPTRPFPGDFTAMSRPYRTFGAATSKLNALARARRCGW